MGRGAVDPMTTSPDKPANGAFRGRVVVLEDVAAERVRWLWPGRLPRGKLVCLDGAPATGKSTLSLDIAARVSTGAEWPDGAAGCPPGGVLLLSAEDGLGDTVRPRLEAAAADLTRVYSLTEVATVAEDGREVAVPPSLPADLALIEQVINDRGVALVVFDVFMAFLAGKVDSHRDQDVRGVLHRLGAVAERTDACMVLIRHLRKSSDGSAINAGGGSIGIVGAARAGFIAARDPEDESGERRILAASKANLARLPASLAYRLISHPTLGVATVEWDTEPSFLTADQLLARVEDRDVEASAVSEWLRAHLEQQGGCDWSQDVKKAGRAAGFSVDQLKRTLGKVGVKVTSEGFPRRTMWSLPEDSGRTHPSTHPTAPTAPTAPTEAAGGLILLPDAASEAQSEQSERLVQSVSPWDVALTGVVGE